MDCERERATKRWLCELVLAQSPLACGNVKRVESSLDCPSCRRALDQPEQLTHEEKKQRGRIMNTRSREAAREKQRSTAQRAPAQPQTGNTSTHQRAQLPNERAPTTMQPANNEQLTPGTSQQRQSQSLGWPSIATGVSAHGQPSLSGPTTPYRYSTPKHVTEAWATPGSLFPVPSTPLQYRTPQHVTDAWTQPLPLSSNPPPLLNNPYSVPFAAAPGGSAYQ